VTLLAYFDESESKDPRIYSVAGFLFEAHSYALLDAEWRAVLEEYGLTHFHMVDCAHGTNEFSMLSKPRRIELQTRLFDIINQRAMLALEMTFDCKHEALLQGHGLYGLEDLSPHNCCAWWAVRAVATWIRHTQPEDDVIYNFEAGSSEQVELNKMMHTVFEVDQLADRFRYVEHAFVKKRDASGVQCADAIAWHAAKNQKRLASGQGPRADYVALRRTQAITMHFDFAQTRRLAKIIRRANSIIADRRTALNWWSATFQEPDAWTLTGSKPRTPFLRRG
jgi:hypothetical protein